MPKAPIEHREAFKDSDPRVSKAAKASPEQSVETLTTMLETKDYRMNAFASPADPQSREQFDVEKDIISQRLNLIREMA